MTSEDRAVSHLGQVIRFERAIADGIWRASTDGPDGPLVAEGISMERARLALEQRIREAGQNRG